MRPEEFARDGPLEECTDAADATRRLTAIAGIGPWSAAEVVRIVFGDPGASDRLLAELQAVTAADVQRVALSIMDDSRAVTIRYLPEDPDAEGDVIADSKRIQPVVFPRFFPIFEPLRCSR